MNSFIKVNGMFDELKKHMVSSKALTKRAHKEDDTFIEGQPVWTLDDGMEVELCLWSCYECIDDASFYDVSIDRAKFDASGNTDFLQYLKSKGVHLCNVEDRFGKFIYLGLNSNDTQYRIQYLWPDDFDRYMRSEKRATEYRKIKTQQVNNRKAKCPSKSQAPAVFRRGEIQQVL